MSAALEDEGSAEGSSEVQEPGPAQLVHHYAAMHELCIPLGCVKLSHRAPEHHCSTMQAIGGMHWSWVFAHVLVLHGCDVLLRYWLQHSGK